MAPLWVDLLFHKLIHERPIAICNLLATPKNLLKQSFADYWFWVAVDPIDSQMHATLQIQREEYRQRIVRIRHVIQPQRCESKRSHQ